MSDRKPTRQTCDKPEPQAASASVRACGVIALGCSIGAALMLSLGSLFEIALPGCGPASACAQAAAGPFGRVPGIDWPVSFVGLAYFTATLATWLSTRGAVSAAMRAVVRGAVLVSLAFVAILLIERTFCAYCLAAHAGHFVFWIALERGSRPAHESPRPLIALTLVFVLINGMLVPFHASRQRAVRDRAEIELARSTAEIIAATAERSADILSDRHETTRDQGPAMTTATTVLGGRFQEIRSAGPVEILDAKTLTSKPDAPGFASRSGRHRLGPERAAIRLVVFSDYECRDCQRIDGEVRALLGSRSDLSVTARHFPMCSDCNPHLPNKMHPNACWAARAAEAAGILRGNDGFFEMHRWLFDRRGRFTDAELREAAGKLGYDADEFVRVMMSERTLTNVQADIEEAMELGLHFTPMIFVNGVELRGWQARDGVRRTVEAVARTIIRSRP